MTRHAREIDGICDEFRWWPEPHRGAFFRYTRLRHLADELPIPVRTDRHPRGLLEVRDALKDTPDVAVFDFAHAAVLAPETLPCPSVMFTHNVEAEIFKRHLDVATNPAHKAIWANQYRKMRRFEQRALRTFDVAVAVSERDARQFVDEYAVAEPYVIPTGVDLEFFTFEAPMRARDVVFLGSMDWMANQEGVTFFMDEVWDEIVTRVPDARMTVVGRAPPEAMIRAAEKRRLNWRFTGFVDDVRPYVQGSSVSVIPLRVGGGTRLKVYEAMAMGSPVVSTAIGVEGLPVEPGKHYVLADSPADFAVAVADLLLDEAARIRIAREARSVVEEKFSYTVAARAFEEACFLAIARRDETQKAAARIVA